MQRLWGHKDRVGPGPPDLSATVVGVQPGFEQLEFPDDAPIAFLSYSLLDLHFAARVRLALRDPHQLRVWVAGGEMRHEHELFTDIGMALDGCDFMLVLVTASSLSSAWVDTEITTAVGKDKLVGFIIDASDSDLMRLMATWGPGTPNEGIGDRFHRDHLWDIGIRFARISTEERGRKFREGADQFLSSLSRHRLCVYPQRPEDWNGNAAIVDFGNMVDAMRHDTKEPS